MPDTVAPRSSIDDRLRAAGLPGLPRPVWLEIDEAALMSNLSVIREMVGQRVAVNAVVKADAYGHGMVAVARVLESAGADRLCVASLDEALALRAAGVALPVIVLFPIPGDAAAQAARERVEIVAADVPGTLRLLDAWRRAARPADATLGVHLEVETGLSRGGVTPAAVAALARQLSDTPGVDVVGLWSHLATPEDATVTAAQVAAFEAAGDELRSAGLGVPARHLAATGGLLTAGAPLYEGVRPGLALYGVLPDGLSIDARRQALVARLRPALALRCRPLRVESISAGTPVGYGGRWHASRDSVIATLPVGYGDGWHRSSWPGSEALVRGRRVPLVGTVAMDALMVDVTDVPGVGLDDEFTLIGDQRDTSQIVTNEVARVRNTIPWEVTTSMAYRVPRVYHAGSVLLGLRTLAGEARVESHVEGHRLASEAYR